MVGGSKQKCLLGSQEAINMLGFRRLDLGLIFLNINLIPTVAFREGVKLMNNILVMRIYNTTIELKQINLASEILTHLSESIGICLVIHNVNAILFYYLCIISIDTILLPSILWNGYQLNPWTVEFSYHLLNLSWTDFIFVFITKFLLVQLIIDFISKVY